MFIFTDGIVLFSDKLKHRYFKRYLELSSILTIIVLATTTTVSAWLAAQ